MLFYYLFWTGYAAWLTLFALIAWWGKPRMLIALGTVMILAFVAYCIWFAKGTVRGDQVGQAVLTVFAAAVLIVPPIVAAIAYSIGRFWKR